MNILVSSCLLGVPCRYDGTGRLEESVRTLMKNHNLIPVCPEQLGGMATPRTPSEKAQGKVFDKEGLDVTEPFEKGAEIVADLARLYGCKLAVLKERSPSCGSGQIYDGTFSKRLVPGDGVTAKRLKDQGITVLGESQVQEFLARQETSRQGRPEASGAPGK